MNQLGKFLLYKYKPLMFAFTIYSKGQEYLHVAVILVTGRWGMWVWIMPVSQSSPANEHQIQCETQSQEIVMEEDTCIHVHKKIVNTQRVEWYSPHRKGLGNFIIPHVTSFNDI